MAVTLVDYFKEVDNPLKKGFIRDLLRHSDLMGIVPIVQVPGLLVTGSRWQTLPSVAGRKIGGGYTESTGTTEEIAETLALLGGDVKIDRVLARQFKKDGGRNPLQTQMQMKAVAVAFAFNDWLINGDQSVDPDQVEGVKKRVSNMPARMTINIDLDLDGTGAERPVLGSTHQHVFIDALHEAVYKSRATHLLMNETTLLGVSQILRRSGLLNTSRDQFDREILSFLNIPMVDVGLKSDKSTEIITNSEDPGDGGTDSSSIYAVRFDTEDGLHGIELAGMGMDVYDPLRGGEMEAGPQILRRIDWPWGLFNLGQYVIARVKGFEMAAS